MMQRCRLSCTLYSSSNTTSVWPMSSCTWTNMHHACRCIDTVSACKQMAVCRVSTLCRCWQTSHLHTTTAQNCRKPWRPLQQQQPAQQPLQTCNQPGGCTTHIKGGHRVQIVLLNNSARHSTSSNTCMPAHCSTPTAHALTYYTAHTVPLRTSWRCRHPVSLCLLHVQLACKKQGGSSSVCPIDFSAQPSK